MFLDLAAEMLEPLPQVDIAVICAAMARFEECRNNPDQARRVNVEAPKEIADKVLASGGRVLLLSTSAVFDCLKPLRRADELCAPRSAYGRFKAEAEEAVLGFGAGAGVVRLTKVVRADSGIFPGWVESLMQGGPITAFEDHTLCPLPLALVVSVLTDIIECGEGGIFQISGAGDISYLDAARNLATHLGVPHEQVIATSAASAGLLPGEITPFTSLETSRLAAMIGFVPPEARAVLTGMYAEALARARMSAVHH
jgi:dTDP-4-dehydrorhamnose reductase